MKIALTTLGCKVNQTETQSISEKLVKNGHEIVAFEGMADIYLVHSCCVTQTAEKKTRQLVRRANRQNPAAGIGVLGCYAQRSAEELLRLPGVKWVLGTAGRARIVDLISGDAPANLVNPLPIRPAFEAMPVEAHDGRTRAYMKIQDGCNSFCAYCIIPYVRGRERTREKEDILAEAHQLTQSGYREIVLNGINLSAVGGDFLLDICRALDALPALSRIRLGSLEPRVITPGFAKEAAAIEKLCPHFHLSVQSGSESVLKRMNRHYAPADVLAGAAVLRAAYTNPALSADIIAGFPGETEEEHAETLETLKAFAPSFLHVFPYSRRPGTRAAEMAEGLTPAQKQARAAEISILAKESGHAYREAFIGKELPVLCEGFENGLQTGLTPQHLPVCFPAKAPLTNKIALVKMQNAQAPASAGLVRVIG